MGNYINLLSRPTPLSAASPVYALLSDSSSLPDRHLPPPFFPPTLPGAFLPFN